MGIVKSFEEVLEELEILDNTITTKQFANLTDISTYSIKITTDGYDKKCQELKNKQFKNNEIMKNYLNL